MLVQYMKLYSTVCTVCTDGIVQYIKSVQIGTWNMRPESVKISISMTYVQYTVLQYIL